MKATVEQKERWKKLVELETKIENSFQYHEFKPHLLHYLVDMCGWYMRKNAGCNRILYALISRCINLEKRTMGLEMRITKLESDIDKMQSWRDNAT